MSITDSYQISLLNPENTITSGASLAKTLYAFPVDILLSGDLGTGKTTLLRGFAKALSIEDSIVSPTFALEQRYETPYGEMAHIDLYRLTTLQARDLLHASEEHCAIRCIEWPQRLDLPLPECFPQSIAITLEEEGDGRLLSVDFRDIPFPSDDEIATWRHECMVPSGVAKHCDAVAAFIQNVIIPSMKTQHRIVRPQMLRAAAMTHDLLRFLDFKNQAFAITHTEEQEQRWAQLRESYDGLSHESACERFLSERGFATLGRVVGTHGLALPSHERVTIEQKILFYADKRVKMDSVVSLDERFADFRARYDEGKASEESARWYEEAKELEKELFPHGCP